MSEYKVYPVDDVGHILTVPHVVEAEDDQEALEKGRQLLDGHDLDVWEGPRHITLLRHKAE